MHLCEFFFFLDIIIFLCANYHEYKPFELKEFVNKLSNFILAGSRRGLEKKEEIAMTASIFPII